MDKWKARSGTGEDKLVFQDQETVPTLDKDKKPETSSIVKEEESTRYHKILFVDWWFHKIEGNPFRFSW